ncbi:MAG: O-acetyl-ADP-ribose deacetylase [Bacteroidota bacterium]
MLRNRILIQNTDITCIHCDAIINAANNHLLGGGGVDGAIHHRAGPELLEACRKLAGCETGKAKITAGFRLPAKYIIHSVGPVWLGGRSGEMQLLESCYHECLKLAVANKCKIVAFPNISTGIYGFPKQKAAAIAIKTVSEFLSMNQLPEKVIFACFDAVNLEIYNSIYSAG